MDPLFLDMHSTHTNRPRPPSLAHYASVSVSRAVGVSLSYLILLAVLEVLSGLHLLPLGESCQVQLEGTTISRVKPPNGISVKLLKPHHPLMDKSIIFFYNSNRQTT